MDSSTTHEELHSFLNPGEKKLDALHVQTAKSDTPEHVLYKTTLGAHKNRAEAIKSIPRAEFAKTPSRESKKYFAPPKAFTYLNKLSAETGNKYTILRFDIAESHSEEKALSYIQKSHELYDEQKAELSKIVSGNSVDVLQTKNETASPEKVESREDLIEKLDEARIDYAKQIALHTQNVKSKQAQYSKMMADFGVDKKLPPIQPTAEFLSAKKSYLEALKKVRVGGDMLFDVAEAEFLRREAVNASSERTKETVKKALKHWDKVAIAEEPDMFDELLVGSNEVVSAPVEKVSTPAKEPVVEVQKPREVPVVHREKTPASPDRMTIPLGNFKGKVLEVIQETVDGVPTARVFFGDSEIAGGKMVTSGADIQLYPEFKNQQILEKSDEVLAFERAGIILKTLKP